MKYKVWALSCAECADVNLHQPCEACPNWKAQQLMKEAAR